MQIKPINGAQIVLDMPADEYHAHPSTSRSMLADLADSPAKFFGLHRAPNRPPRKPPTPSQFAGTLAHCVLLEPEATLQRYRVKPAGLDLRTKEGKAWAADTPPGLDICSDEQMQTAVAQRDAMHRTPAIAGLLNSDGARTEVSFFWNDPRTGLPLKARTDLIVPFESPTGAGMIVLDYKTATDPGPAPFGLQSARFGYDLQGAFYVEAVERCTGVPVSAFALAAVSSEYPFIAQLYTIDNERAVLDGARQYVHALLTLLLRCERFNLWPAYGEAAQELVLPGWHSSAQQDDVTRTVRLADWVQRTATQPQTEDA